MTPCKTFNCSCPENSKYAFFLSMISGSYLEEIWNLFPSQRWIFSPKVYLTYINLGKYFYNSVINSCNLKSFLYIHIYIYIYIYIYIPIQIIFKHIEKLKKLYTGHSDTCHLYSAINIFLNLFYHKSMHQFVHVLVLMDFIVSCRRQHTSPLNTSVYFIIN